jgi:hypothetical protein
MKSREGKEIKIIEQESDALLKFIAFSFKKYLIKLNISKINKQTQAYEELGFIRKHIM